MSRLRKPPAAAGTNRPGEKHGLLAVLLSGLISGVLFLLPDVSFGTPATSLIQTKDPRHLQMIRALETFIPAMMRAQDVPGLNIALARDGRIVWEGAYGYADARTRRPMATDTVFRSGSIAKGYAAIAILQLVERGLIELDDPIGPHLPVEVRNPLGGSPITFRHLLTHTSGLGGDIASSFLCDGSAPVRSLEEVVRSAYLFQTQQPPTGLKYLHPMWRYPTGTKMQYSNLGVATLGLLVERINPERLSYSDYVQKRIMDAVGMELAQFPPAQARQFVRPEVWSKMSTGYQTMGGAWIPTAQVCFGEFPCGGSLATPRDFTRLLLALMGGGQLEGARLLTKESVEAMFTPAPELRSESSAGLSLASRDRQGLIWRLRDWPSDMQAFWHTGGHMFGWQTIAVAYPRSRTAFVAAVNHWSALSRISSESIVQLQGFVEGWLKQEGAAPDPGFTARWVDRVAGRTVGPAPAIEKLAWKASYLRGLLYAESYQFSIGTPERLTGQQALELAQNTEDALSGRSTVFWDPQAFIIGVNDMSQLAPTAQEIRNFAASGRMRLSLKEAGDIYVYLGAHQDGWANLAGLLNVPAEQ